MKFFLILLTALSLIGCLDSSTRVIVTDDSDSFDNALGLADDDNVVIEYDRFSDSVSFSAPAEQGIGSGSGYRPLTFWGVRLSANTFSNPSRFCSMLGFTDVRLTETISTSAFNSYLIENSVTGSTDNHIYDTEYPAFHMELVETFVGDIFYRSQLKSFYFSDNYFAGTNEYVGAIRCFGTTDVHMDEYGEFDKVNFLQNVFYKQYSDELEIGESDDFLPGYEYLIAEASSNSDLWRITRGFGNKAIYMNPDKRFLPVAERAAQQLCYDYGYQGLLFYTVKYILGSAVQGDKVYKFNDQTYNWRLVNAPEPHDMEAITYGSTDKIHRHEVPSVYLDLVFCQL